MWKSTIRVQNTTIILKNQGFYRIIFYINLVVYKMYFPLIFNINIKLIYFRLIYQKTFINKINNDDLHV